MSSRMWKCAKLSVRGSAHLTNGLPCQDAATALLTGERNDCIAVCAISDGAGSAQYAEEGARLVVESAVAYFGRQLADHPIPGRLVADYDVSDAWSLALEVREKIEETARQRSASVHEFAATLLVCVIHSENSFFVQIGDGCWCASVGGIIGAVTWPSRGEFVGQTDFVTSVRVDPSSENVVQVYRLRRKPDFVIGISDGLERLAVDLQSGIPHQRFFLPIVQKLISADDTAEFEQSLRSFLESERVCDRTDDDKSIVIVAPHARGV